MNFNFNTEDVPRRFEFEVNLTSILQLLTDCLQLIEQSDSVSLDQLNIERYANCSVRLEVPLRDVLIGLLCTDVEFVNAISFFSIKGVRFDASGKSNSVGICNSNSTSF